jgi:hypothetical protein
MPEYARRHHFIGSTSVALMLDTGRPNPEFPQATTTEMAASDLGMTDETVRNHVKKTAARAGVSELSAEHSSRRSCYDH